MTGWVFAGGYLAAWLVTARFAARYFTEMWDDRDRADRMMTVLLGMACGMAWPLALLTGIVMWRLPKSTAQLKAEAAQRDRRIAELERELGMR